MGSGLLAVVRELEQLSTDLGSADIAQLGVDIAQRATDSRIAHLHFLNDDQNTIELGAWSQETLLGCTAVYDRHYPVADAGIWADSARFGGPVIHNDYEHYAGARGLPPGHSRLIRHLGIPVVDAGRVRMLLGVGNKATDYDRADVELLEMIGARIWSVMRQRRVLEHYLDLSARCRHVQQIAWACGLEYDVDEDRLECDAMFASVFAVARAGEVPTSLEALLRFVVAEDRDHVAAALTQSPTQGRVWRVRGLRAATGTAFPAELQVEFRRRELGDGLLANAILRDVSEEMAMADLRRRADTDPLTGLPNRHVLNRLLEQDADRRHSSPGVAFHYIDLDRFKPVNDNHGHLFGDEVLRVVAERLRRSTRQGDVVLRMGGDEFAVVQVGVDGPAGALLLADAIVDAISEPITAHGHTIRVGASVGIAISPDASTPLRDLSAEADRALYRAKAMGGRKSVIAGAWEE